MFARCADPCAGAGGPGILEIGRVRGHGRRGPRPWSERAVPLTHDENSSRPRATGDDAPTLLGPVPPVRPGTAPPRRGTDAVPRQRTAQAPATSAGPRLQHGPRHQPAPPATVGRHRGRRWALLGWRVLVVVVGALLLVVCSAMALGFVAVPPATLGFGPPSGTAPAEPMVRGSDGLYPGGPVRQIP